MNDSKGHDDSAASNGVAPMLLPSIVKSLYETKKYADLTVKCGKRSWKVHKAVVCLQSDFFAKACDGTFKEAELGVVTLQDDEGVVSALLHYFYHGNYDDISEQLDGGDESRISLDIQVYIIADKYLVKPLQDVARAAFAKRLALLWDTIVFGYAVNQVYSLEHTQILPLKTIILEQVIEHRNVFLPHNGVHPNFDAVLQLWGSFAADVVRALAQTLAGQGTQATQPKLKWYRCPGAQCTKYNVMFALDRYPSGCWMNCPMGCSRKLGEGAWKTYEVKKGA